MQSHDCRPAAPDERADLLDHERIRRAACPTGSVEGRRHEESLIDTIACEVGREVRRLNHFTDRHTESADDPVMQSISFSFKHRGPLRPGRVAPP